jgi:hypothetical protein
MAADAALRLSLADLAMSDIDLGNIREVPWAPADP